MWYCTKEHQAVINKWEKSLTRFTNFHCGLKFMLCVVYMYVLLRISITHPYTTCTRVLFQLHIHVIMLTWAIENYVRLMRMSFVTMGPSGRGTAGILTFLLAMSGYNIPSSVGTFLSSKLRQKPRLNLGRLCETFKNGTHGDDSIENSICTFFS